MHELPPLPYAYDALEPFIDTMTMQVHHDKHHKAYCDKFNAALQKHPDLASKKPEDLLKDLESVPEDIRGAVRNAGGGFVNHTFFWQLLKKGVEPKGKVVDAIITQWGSLDAFKKEFSDASINLFGSGWVWLVKDGKKLAILSLPNQDSPLSQGKTPLLTIDVWEHSYYLKYQNRRADYVAAFWNVVNWEKVDEMSKQ